MRPYSHEQAAKQDSESDPTSSPQDAYSESLRRLAATLEATADGLEREARRIRDQAAAKRLSIAELATWSDTKAALRAELLELARTQGGALKQDRARLSKALGIPIESVDHMARQIDREARAERRLERQALARQLALAGWTDREIAARLQVHRSTISRWLSLSG